MAARAVILAIAAASASACVTARPGAPLAGVNTGGLSSLAATASFDHGCPAGRIRVVRVGPGGGIGGTDVDVCGVVRRYKAVAGFAESMTWLDVTALYPASVLPPPLPPER